MNLFVWTDALATGSKFIDQDHHELVRLVNAVLEPIAEQRGNPALTLALGELLDYTREHFAREEAEMQRIAFADVAAHMAAHTQLLGQLDEVRQRLEAQGQVQEMDLYHFLTWWVKDHIRDVDMVFAAALRAHHQGL